MLSTQLLSVHGLAHGRFGASNCVHDELRESPYSKGSVRRDNRFRGMAVEVRAVSEGEAFNSHEEASEAARNEKRICN